MIVPALVRSEGISPPIAQGLSPDKNQGSGDAARTKVGTAHVRAPWFQRYVSSGIKIH